VELLEWKAWVDRTGQIFATRQIFAPLKFSYPTHP